MRVKALVIRILRQFFRDKRTLALMIFAPLLILTMLHLVFNGDDYIPKVGLVKAPNTLLEKMDLDGAEWKVYEDLEKADQDLNELSLDAYIRFDGSVPAALILEGSDPSVNGAVVSWFQDAVKPLQPRDEKAMVVEYLHGSDRMNQFDYYGPVLLGFFAFFFVFIVAGISFLRERTSGTLERLMASPIRKWEIVTGYVLGFGLFTIVQAGLMAWYAIYVLGMLMEGTFVFVLLITLSLSMTALTLGILLSAFANNEFQMIQFIPIVAVPQIFFSGLFNLETISGWLSWIGPFTPLYYAASALRDIMVRGYGWGEIFPEVFVLLGFSLFFILLNIAALRKYRSV